MDLRDVIDVEFYKGESQPRASNVGELILILQRLPSDLPVYSSFDSRVEVGVYNISGEFGTPHAEITEPEG